MCRPDAHGICWHACTCDEGGRCDYPPQEQPCSRFSCQEAGWRQKGSAQECVQDACVKVS